MDHYNQSENSISSKPFLKYRSQLLICTLIFLIQPTSQILAKSCPDNCSACIMDKKINREYRKCTACKPGFRLEIENDTHWDDPDNESGRILSKLGENRALQRVNDDIVSGNCTPCAVPNCSKCNKSKWICSSCKEGYFKKHKSSSAEIRNLQFKRTKKETYISEEFPKIGGVQTNVFDIERIHTCYKCVDNCINCSTTTRCDSCKFLYTLSADKTVCENDSQVVIILLMLGILAGTFCSCCFMCLFQRVRGGSSSNSGGSSGSKGSNDSGGKRSKKSKKNSPASDGKVLDSARQKMVTDTVELPNNVFNLRNIDQKSKSQQNSPNSITTPQFNVDLSPLSGEEVKINLRPAIVNKISELEKSQQDQKSIELTGQDLANKVKKLENQEVGGDSSPEEEKYIFNGERRGKSFSFNPDPLNKME